MQFLENTINRIGKISSWLTLAMIGMLFTVVLLRYVFSIGWIAMQESVLWLHATVFLLTAAWTLGMDGHVRVDVFYREFSVRRKAWVDLFGTILFLFPVAGFLLYSSLPYVRRSWAIGESSFEAGGLPAIYLLKTLIPLASVLLLLQGLVIVYKQIKLISNAKQSINN